MRQYSNKQLPKLFCSMFQYLLSLSQQVYRDHDYSMKPKVVFQTSVFLTNSTISSRSWNHSNLLVKAEGEINALRAVFLNGKINNYAEEYEKLICYDLKILDFD